MVAVLFPEAGLILGHEADAAQPLGGLPEVQMRHDQTGRAAMLGRDGLAVKFEGDHAATFDHVPGGQVGGVAAVGEGHEVGRNVADAGGGEQVVDGHAFPGGVQLAPLGDAMDVGEDFGLGQAAELLPSPFAEGFAIDAHEGESPLIQRDALGRAGGEHREATLQVLAGRNGTWRRFTTPAEKPSCDHRDLSP